MLDTVTVNAGQSVKYVWGGKVVVVSVDADTEAKVVAIIGNNVKVVWAASPTGFALFTP